MSDISEKLAAMRGDGHHVPVGLGEILEEMDKRISALEPKSNPGKKDPGDELNS